MSSPRSGCEILCIGTELLLGNILNGNARWLAESLASLGIPHFRQGVVGDNPERLREAVVEAAGRSRLLICTGGLGPTPDDLTTETLAACFGVPLEERPEVLADLEAKLRARGAAAWGSATANRHYCRRGLRCCPTPPVQLQESSGRRNRASPC